MWIPFKNKAIFSFVKYLTFFLRSYITGLKEEKKEINADYQNESIVPYMSSTRKSNHTYLACHFTQHVIKIAQCSGIETHDELDKYIKQHLQGEN